MKPKEFDELIRQKFDQNDFEYNPRNWDMLVDELDGRAKKRNVIMWWLMPLAGVAASVALAMSVPAFLSPDQQASPLAKVRSAHSAQPAIGAEQGGDSYAAAQMAATPYHHAPIAKAKKKHVTSDVKEEADDKEFIALRFHDNDQSRSFSHATIDLLNAGDVTRKDKIKKEVAVEVSTFKEEAPVVKKAPKLSIILSGGIARGSQNNGYTAGATIRRMINDKVYVEGDVAFASSNNTQTTQYLTTADGTPIAGKYSHSGAKTSAPESYKTTAQPEAVGVIKEANVNYTLSYAQVTPSIGYKIMKRMSLAAGPDFQQMLVDNRPAASTVDRNQIQEVPAFDIGLIGKSEYNVTKRVKAGVSYRKGINSVITPTDKYIDRDYLQFQLKCIIFNK